MSLLEIIPGERSPRRTIRIEITNKDGTPWLPTAEELAVWKASIDALPAAKEAA